MATFEVIHHPDDVLDSMNEWCVKHHGESGLTKAVRDSKVDLRFESTNVPAYSDTLGEREKCCWS